MISVTLNEYFYSIAEPRGIMGSCRKIPIGEKPGIGNLSNWFGSWYLHCVKVVGGPGTVIATLSARIFSQHQL